MPKLVECIPNFSISREKDRVGYDALMAEAERLPGCTLVEAHSDGQNNRSMFKLVGTPEGVVEGALRLSRLAVGRIDMNFHRGRHARIGAVDVIPLIPMSGMTVADCAQLAHRLGRRMWQELGVPVFLYEGAATRPDCRSLSNIRRGEFEGMPEKLLQPQWAPDFGQRQIHPTAGVTAIGARKHIVAFNVNLETKNQLLAQKIAQVVQDSFDHCRAMGFLSEERGLAQVSMSITDYEETPLYAVLERVRTLAEFQKTQVVDTEIVGNVPAEALLDCAEFYLKTRNFNSSHQVLECHLMELE